MSDTPQRAEAPPLAWREALAALAILLALTLALHTLAFRGYFILDDWINIGWLPEGKSVGHLFIGNWIDGGHPPDSGALYRPIPRISFLLDRAIWGLDRPWGFHLTNLILHGLCIFFLWGIARSLWRSRWVAWGAALLFWAHPLTVEPAQWISARTDLWAAVFSFPAIWLTIALTGAPTGEGRAGFPRPRFWSLPLMALALCSKETAVVLPALLLFIDLLRQRGWTRARLIWWVATIGLWACYFGLRRMIFGEFLGYGMAERYMSLAGYGRAVICAVAVISLLVLIPLVVISTALCLWRRVDLRPLLLASVWFLLSLVPLTALGFSWTENTRLLYPGVAAFCLLTAGSMAWALDPPMRRERALLSVSGAVLICWLALSLGFAVLRISSWSRASRECRTVVESIAEDLMALPADGAVVIEPAPERSFGITIFRTIDLSVAVATLLDERGVSHGPILSRPLGETDPGDDLLIRERGSDSPFSPVTAIIDFRTVSEGVGYQLPGDSRSEIVRWDSRTDERRVIGEVRHGGESQID
ncbi:hypothetical protein JXA47_10625 [Candidatus Sumerlaeota bacterium]|nr:hypothetical protein [Candidatus Sumerlaeota bacterium]